MSLTFCHCCKRPIGIDQLASSWQSGALSWVFLSEYAPITFVEWLSTDIAALDQVHVIFAGNRSECGNAIRFAEADWPAVRAWIEAGGRFHLATEHSGNHPEVGGEYETGFKCLQDMARVNAFIAAMGGTMTYRGGDFVDNSIATPGTALIATVNSYVNNRIGHLEPGSGKIVFTGNISGKTAMVAEKLGNGFLFVEGDSNSFGGTTPNNYYYKLWHDADDEIY